MTCAWMPARVAAADLGAERAERKRERAADSGGSGCREAQGGRTAAKRGPEMEW